MKKISKINCVVQIILVIFGNTYAIYNPTESATKPPYTKKIWSSLALNPEDQNSIGSNIIMHHNYSRVYVNRNAPLDSKNFREPKSEVRQNVDQTQDTQFLDQQNLDQTQDGTQVIEQVSNFPTEEQSSTNREQLEQKSDHIQHIQRTNAEEIRKRNDELLKLYHQNKTAQLNPNKKLTAQTIVHDKLLPLDSNFAVNDKLEPLNRYQQAQGRNEQTVRLEQTSNYGEQTYTGTIPFAQTHQPNTGYILRGTNNQQNYQNGEQTINRREQTFRGTNESAQSYQASTGVAGYPPLRKEIEVHGFHYPPRQNEIYPYNTIKPYSNMAFENCPKDVTGQIVYLWSCSQYLNCWKGRSHIQNCPAGTLFNPETLECDFTHKVNCISGPHNQKVQFEQYTSSTGIDQRNQRTNTQQKQLDQICGPNFSGLIPHPADCSKFINCANGKTIIQDCGPGTAFNAKIQACDWPYNVDCESTGSSDLDTTTLPYILHEQDLRMPKQDYQEYSNYGRDPVSQGGNYNYRTDQSLHQESHSGLPTLRDVQTSRQYTDTGYNTQQFGSGCLKTNNPADSLNSGCNTQQSGSQPNGYNAQPTYCTGSGCTNTQFSPTGSIQPSTGCTNTNQQTGCTNQPQGGTITTSYSTTTYDANQQGYVTNQQQSNPINPNIKCDQNPNHPGCNTQQSGSQPNGYNAQPSYCTGSGCTNTQFSPTGNIQPSTGCNNQQTGCTNQPQGGTITTSYGTTTYDANQQGYVTNQQQGDPVNPNIKCDQNPNQYGCNNNQNIRRTLQTGYTVTDENLIIPQTLNCAGSNRNCQQNPQNTGSTTQYGGAIQGSNCAGTNQNCAPPSTNQFGSRNYQRIFNVTTHTWELVPIIYQTPQSGHSIPESGSQPSDQQWTTRPLHHHHHHHHGHSTPGSTQNTGQQTWTSGTNYGRNQDPSFGNQESQSSTNYDSHLRYTQTQHGQQIGYQQRGSSKQEAKCPAGHSGLLAHPFICAKFLNCANGITYVQDCGPGTVFNSKISVCDWPYNVDCKSGNTESRIQNTTSVHHGITTSGQYGPQTSYSHTSGQTTNYGSTVGTNYQPPGTVYQPTGTTYQPTGSTQPNGNFGHTTSYQPRGTYSPSSSHDQNYGSSSNRNYYIQTNPNSIRNTTSRNYIGVIGHRRSNPTDPTSVGLNQNCTTPNCSPINTQVGSSCYGASCSRSNTNFIETGSHQIVTTGTSASGYPNTNYQSGYVPIQQNRPDIQQGRLDPQQGVTKPNCYGSQCVNSKLDFGTSKPQYAPNSNLQQTNTNQRNESNIYYITPIPANQPKYGSNTGSQIPANEPSYGSNFNYGTTPKYTAARKGGSLQRYPTSISTPVPLEPLGLESFINVEENKNKKGSDHWPAPFPSTDVNVDYDFDTEDATEQPQSKNKHQKIWKSAGKCQENEFLCKINECIPATWVCDGNQDCSNGYDEINCGSYVKHFSKIPNSRLYKHEIEKWLNTELDTCANYCVNSKSFGCKSFNFRKEENICLLCDTNVGTSGALAMSHLYDYYEISALSVNCTGMYECSNKKCINFTQVCDGNDDCGNRQDEKYCKAEALGYSIKLAGSQAKNEGRIEVKVFQEWGYICDDKFGLRNADVVCKELGYPQGALEVKSGSHFAKDVKDNETFYLMDDVQCIGNETSIRNCDFSGWGVHNCMPQEIVGVICKTEQEVCPAEHWKCDTTSECLPMQFLCDGVFDCADHSDEGSQHCQAPIELRLADGATKLEGRVEVRYHGVWGTICDDDFNDNTAKVICQSMGYRGSAVAKKDGAFGAGIGPIWLDQVNCFGNESFVDDCSHWSWGEHNCEHSEDAGVVCSNVDTSEYEKRSKNKNVFDMTPAKQPVDDIFKGKCGHTGEDLFFEDENKNSDVHFRVVKGSKAKKGQYPWQATIRVKGKNIKSSHWCGAVVISNKFVLTAAHCLVGFAKGSYIVRAGDYNIDEEEGTEVEAFIEDFFVHEKFRQGGHMNNDIALIKMKGSGLRLSKQVQPICLPDKNTNYKPGLNCTISGFGSTESGKSTSSHVLQAGWIKIQPENICKMSQVYGESITKGMFCAGSLDEGVDSCDGDSGGPLACLDKGLFTLYGLTSWGQRCGHANKPGVYVRISHYRDWIDKKIEENI